MFFILSKTVGLLLNPMVLLLLLLLTGLLVRNMLVKRFSLGLFTILFLVFSNPVITNEVTRWWEIPPVPFSELRGTYDAAIVLGGVTASNKLPTDRVHLNKGADRILHAIQLYKLGKVKRIILSGGSGELEGEGISEAERMQQVMLLSGIPARHILLEPASRNTHENALFTSQLLEEKLKDERYLLVTSAFHMPRALASFKQEGVRAIPFSADIYSSSPSYSITDYFIPKAEALFTWSQLLREWFGMITYDTIGYI